MPLVAAWARISESAIPPLATAAPSVFIARPIQAPATIGSCHRKVCGSNGRISTSTTENTTTSDDTITGTAGRGADSSAPPVAMAADTPQIEMPEERHRPFAENPNYLRETK